MLRVIVANDVGYAINPLGLHGQIEGGVMMGIGHALTEELHRRGRPRGHRPAGALPHPLHHPAPRRSPPSWSSIPPPDGPYGAKGVGEIVIIPTAPAITNAIYNAVGVRVDRLPVDQEMVLQAIQGQGIVLQRTQEASR